MKHLGDITKISGYDVEPTWVVCGGSPCQDLSVAGKRAGLAGARSGLFMEQIRIIKEMREKDEASEEIAKILKSLPRNINCKELEALAMAQIALAEWPTQYECGYIDGNYDGIFSELIEQGFQEKMYRENFYEIDVIIDE